MFVIMKKRILLILTSSIAMCILLVPFYVTNAIADSAKAARPRIALVLSGGGARGLAHIGVLKALKEMRIPIDCVVGTSMGALVGGMYASGMSPEQIDQMVADNDLASLFEDSPSRADRPFITKRADYRPLFDFSLGVNSEGVHLPPAASAGYRFELFIKEIIGLAATTSNLDFDQLPTPFRATATNIENGKLKIFKRGDLSRALRASMSLPGIIAPATFEGQTYIDGGLVNNLPVEVGQALCGDIIVAVNLGTKPKNINEITSSLDVVSQSYLLLSEQNIERSIAKLTHDDFLILPELKKITSSDFSNYKVIINEGVLAVHRQNKALEKLSVSFQEYQQWLSIRQAKILKPIKISSISAQSTGKVNNEVVLDDITTKAGKQFNLKQFNTELVELFGREDFSYIGYSVVVNDKKNDKADIIIDAVSKPWGPGYLKFGIGVATDFDSPTQFNLAVNYRQTWVNSLGAEWRTEIQMGYDTLLSTEFFQPLQVRDGAFIRPYTALQRGTIQFYQGKLNIGEFEVKQFNAGLDLGITNKFGVLKLGPYFHRVRTVPDFSLSTGLLKEKTTSQVGVRLDAVYDQLDSLQFPRSGSRASVRVMATNKQWGSDEEYTLAQLKFSTATSFGAHSLLGHFEWGDDISNTNNLPINLAFKLGGPGRLSGLNINQLTGSRYGLASLNYYYQYDSLPAQLGRGMYMGMSVETGRINDLFLNDNSKFNTSGSIFWGADTILGAIYIGYGISNLNQNTFYLTINNNYY